MNNKLTPTELINDKFFKFVYRHIMPMKTTIIVDKKFISIDKQLWAAIGM